LNVLVIDVGGSSVKMAATGRAAPVRVRTGRRFSPSELVARVREVTSGWRYDVVALGYPGLVDATGPVEEPGNLGHGWVGFDFAAALGRPVRIANDAVLQALGAYAGGRMLFLGLGTGVGSALVAEQVAIPLELGSLSCGRRTLAERLGKLGLKRYGAPAWRRGVRAATTNLRQAFAADYVVLGGGNASRMHPLPDGARLGGNDDAIQGGFRLWEEEIEPHDRRPLPVWRVVR
jgi:predicted NBD/HSP70 family sugar kinase